MPIYAYRCDSCGVEKDVLQKLSDAPLTVCPECGASAFNKRLSAPAFQLKGSGWYVTDFRDGARKAKAEGADAGDGKAGGSGRPEGKADGKDRSAAGDGQRSDAGQAAAAATPPAAAAATPAASERKQA